MAAKEQSAQSTGGMLGEVEQRPKKDGNFGGREADPAKVQHLMNIFSEFAKYAKGRTFTKRDQVPVPALGAWTPSSLAITGNKILDKQRAGGTDPGFYLVATDREVLEGHTKEKPNLGPPRKLVIRPGVKPTRKPAKAK